MMKNVKVVMGTLLIVLATFSFLYLQGCNKQGEKVSDNTTSTDNKQASAFSESDADLVNVDYKDFYDKLAPKGEWIKVTPDDLGIKANTTSDIEHPSKSMLLSEVFGVNTAIAQETAAGAFFVWKPAPELALGVSAGAPSLATPLVTTDVVTAPAVAPAMYVPYTNGSWVNTDNGWYFQAATPEEEIVHHYGRWEYSPSLGWVWLPGKVWSPAWVDWKKDDNLMAWAPLPYSTVVVNDAVTPVVIPAERYVTIEQPHFLDPVYTYRYIAPDPVLTVQSMSPLPGIVVVNNVLVDRGPDVVYVEKVTGKKVIVYPINRVVSFSDVRFKDNVIYTYTPAFKTYDYKKVNLNRPEKVTEFLAAREKYGNKFGDMQKMRKENEGNGNVNKGSFDGNKQKEMKQKENDNRMPVYKNNEKKHDNPVKEKKNVNPVKEKKNDNGNQNKGNKGNDNKGKEDHGKKGGNDSKPQVKGNDKPSDHGNKGNDKGGDHGKKGK